MYATKSNNFFRENNMNGMIKKYLPYALIIFAVYLLVPLIFLIPALRDYSTVAYYFIFLVTQVACSAAYCAKQGLDFLFALIAPIAFIPSMLIYNGGFTQIQNLVLVFVYLVAGIFGLYLGDLAFGDERRKREKKEKQEAEEMLLQAKRHDEEERERLGEKAEQKPAAKPAKPVQRAAREKSRRARPSGKPQRPMRYETDDDDDFDYDKYTDEMHRELDERVSRLLDDE